MEVCRIAQEAVYPTDPSRIVTVGVILGDRSPVEPANFEFCLEVLLREPPFGQGQAVMTRIPGEDLRLDYVEVADAGSPD